MQQRDYDALQRDFGALLSADDFALLIEEAEAAPSSFARCNVMAEWRKRTHYQREAQIVEAHAVDGVLYCPIKAATKKEAVEPVHAVDRMHPAWWNNSMLWKELGRHCSHIEREALKNIQDATSDAPVVQMPKSTQKLPLANFLDVFAEVWKELCANDQRVVVSDNHLKTLGEIHQWRGVRLEHIENDDGSLLPIEVDLKAA